MTTTPLTLPTQNELPCDDGVPMDTQRHKLQTVAINPCNPMLKTATKANNWG